MLRLTSRLNDERPTPLLEAGYAPHLARVLWARGVRSGEEAQAFLNPCVDDLPDPRLLDGVAAAADRIRRAMEANERIIIYGDYDVDGVCAAAILVEAIRAHGGRADWYIPSRHREGYGLNEAAVRSLADACDLLVTVDCGITSVQEADVASSIGLDLIITDHHEPAAVLPRALVIVDPMLGGYPFPRLCGAGVAFKLAWALFGRDAVAELWELAALATVADLVPLLGENRIIVHEGLRRMQHTKRPGLRALLDVAGLTGKQITSGHLAFQIGPRINAGGRLGEASENVALLLTDDEARARDIAAALSSENARRQQMEADILKKADQWVRENADFLHDRALVIAGEGWNSGVVGLVASRLVERYAWPVVVLTENEEGALTGSARSIPGVNIHAALTQCADLFTRFGGHAQAAGMTLPKENLAPLRERLNAAAKAVAERDAFVPSVPYDLDITLAEITIPLIEQLDKLAPTGFGNPAPVFRLADARVIEARGVGAEGKHLKLHLAQESAALSGIAFGQGAMRAVLPERITALFSPSINEYMGKRSAQCEVARILPHAAPRAFLAQCQARADAFDCYLLENAGYTPAPAPDAALREAVRTALTESCQGTLLTVRTLDGAQAWLAWLIEEGLSDRLDFCFEAPADIRAFNTLCALPNQEAQARFPRVIALDDHLVARAARGWLPTDDTLRELYRTLRGAQGQFASEAALAAASGMRLAAVRLGLRTFAELGLIDYSPVPFAAALRPAHKCSLQSSAVLRAVRGAWQGEEIV